MRKFLRRLLKIKDDESPQTDTRDMATQTERPQTEQQPDVQAALNATVQDEQIDDVNNRDLPQGTPERPASDPPNDARNSSMKHIKTVLNVKREFREYFEGLPELWNGMGFSKLCACNGNWIRFAHIG